MSFFVTAIRGQRVAFLAGPFGSHDDAIAALPTYRRRACEIDPWCDFDAFGTARSDRTKPGVLTPELAGASS